MFTLKFKLFIYSNIYILFYFSFIAITENHF